MQVAMSSRESEVLRCYSADLVTAISAADPLGLALKLFSRNLVERATVEDVCLPTNSPTTKGCIIVTAVDRKVEADPSFFHPFTALLQDEGDSMKAIIERVMDKYSSILDKELCPSTLPPHYTPHQPSPPQPHSPLSLYADRLRTIYTQSELPKYSNPACYKWTPSPSKKYIDLSTIDRKGMTTEQVDEHKSAALYGKITRKGSDNTVKLEELLQTKAGEKLECVLIEGAPGIGKSTMAWQVCNRWGKRELFQQFSAVLLLPLRDQRVQGATYVEDLLINADKKLQEKVHQKLSQENWDGKDTLIILEGLDELPSHLLSQPSIFTALLAGEVLPQATILITSRPSATEQLHKYWKQRISRHFEISGFTEENVVKYAHSILPNHEQLSGFKEYISIYPHIQSMLYVPLHCVIAVTVYLQCQHSRTPPPKTSTGLYTCLTQTILTQFLNDHQDYIGKDNILDTVFDLHIPHLVNNLFKELCRIAFEHLRDQKLVFSDMPKELIHNLGFTNAVPELLLYQQSPSYSYNFLHLSVQEFLAAYHVSLMSPSEQEQLLQTDCCWPNISTHFRNMFRFVAGITKFERLNKVAVRHAIGISENTRLGYYSLEMLYECQDMSILDVEQTYRASLRLPPPHLCIALGYCIANSSCGWELVWKNCYNELQAEMILQGLQESKEPCTTYSVKSIHCTDCHTDFTHKLFTQHTPKSFVAYIESLTFAYSNSVPLPPCLPEMIISMKRLESVTLKNVLNTSLQELLSVLDKISSLRTLKIESGSAKFYMEFHTGSHQVSGTYDLMGVVFPHLPQSIIAHIESLRVDYDSHSHKADPHQAPLLRPSLPELIPTMQLKTLYLFCSFNVVEAVSGALAAVSLLKTLEVRSCFTLQSMQAFASMLKQNQSLTEVKAPDCRINDDMAYCLADALHHNTTLRKLDMRGNPIGDRGALAMAKVLKQNTSLEELNLSHVRISIDSVVVVAEALHYNTSLRKLDMSANPVGERGALAMADMLKHNTTLEELNLKDNNYIFRVYHSPDEGLMVSKILVESLKVNKYLRKLGISSRDRKFVEILPVYQDHKERLNLD